MPPHIPDGFVDYIHHYMHPQAVFVDTSGAEEDYFLAAFRKQAPDLGIPVIELPEKAESILSWVTKLDSSSLAGKSTNKLETWSRFS